MDIEEQAADAKYGASVEESLAMLNDRMEARVLDARKREGTDYPLKVDGQPLRVHRLTEADFLRLLASPGSRDAILQRFYRKSVGADADSAYGSRTYVGGIFSRSYEFTSHLAYLLSHLTAAGDAYAFRSKTRRHTGKALKYVKMTPKYQALAKARYEAREAARVERAHKVALIATSEALVASSGIDATVCPMRGDVTLSAEAFATLLQAAAK